MKAEIRYTGFKLDIFGFSGQAVNRNYAETAFQLMNKMWQTVKSQELKNKGMNIWVYEPFEKVFAGVELYGTDHDDTGLEQKTIHIVKYAYYKHVGPYGLLKQTGENMKDELRRNGFSPGFPYIEIYGHWTNDETKLETELLMSLT